MIKDLRLIKNTNLKSSIILDSSVYSFAYNISNGIPILPFDDQNQNDCELIPLIPLLIKASKVQDVREELKEKVKLLEIAEEACGEKQKA